MSDYNPERRRDQKTDFEAITSSRFLKTSNQGSDDNEDEEEANVKPSNSARKIKTTSILKNSSTRITKPNASSHTSRLQSFQNNENNDNQDFEENDEEESLDDSQNEIEDDSEKYPLSNQQLNTRNGQTQKSVKIMTKFDKPSTGYVHRVTYASSSAPQQHTSFKDAKNSSSGSGYEMSK